MLGFFTAFTIMVVAVIVLRLLLREKLFSQEVPCYLVDPNHTFEFEMAAQIIDLKMKHPNTKSYAFRKAMSALHAEYHELALQNGWLKLVI
jgi:hypothetical protein